MRGVLCLVLVLAAGCTGGDSDGPAASAGNVDEEVRAQAQDSGSLLDAVEDVQPTSDVSPDLSTPDDTASSPDSLVPDQTTAPQDITAPEDTTLVAPVELLPDEWWQELESEMATPASLVQLPSCEDLDPLIRQRMINAMIATVEAMKDRVLAARMVKVCFGDNPQCTFAPNGSCVGLPVSSELIKGMLDMGGSINLPAPSSPQHYSDTNTQVEGVDEPDFVKTDGQHIYAVAGGMLHIIDAWPPAQAGHISKTQVEGTPHRLYVHDDKAVIFSRYEPFPVVPPVLLECPIWASLFSPGSANDEVECTYGYDCEFTGDGYRQLVLVYDISDRSAPVLVRRLDLRGAYIGSRRVDSGVFTFIELPPLTVPGLSFLPDGLDDLLPDEFDLSDSNLDGSNLPPAAKLLFDALVEANTQLILNAPPSMLTPVGTDTTWVDGQPVVEPLELTACADLLLSPLEAGGGLVSLVGFDLDTSAPPDVVTILGRPGVVYGNADAMYLGVRQYEGQSMLWPAVGPLMWNQATLVHRFPVNADMGTVEYSGSGAVPGRLLNQFALDEWQGHLRIATRINDLAFFGLSSEVHILQTTGSTLEPVGSVSGLGPAEDLRSVRFQGPVGYVVTFENTDPLYILDLSDPAAPAVAGELVIPGFSTYIHPLDDEHLLTIGYDADSSGTLFEFFDGIRLQVIDVSDMADPVLEHVEIIGTSGTTSDAAVNHLAFNWFPAEARLALPMALCEGGSFGNWTQEAVFNGLMVYEVDVDSGFDYLGGVPHPMPEEGTSCFNWWTTSKSQVKRSIFMDDWVFSIALDEIRVAPVTGLNAPVQVIGLD